MQKREYLNVFAPGYYSRRHSPREWTMEINGERTITANFGVEDLNKWGDEGWELAITNSTGNYDNQLQLIFARPKS